MNSQSKNIVGEFITQQRAFTLVELLVTIGIIAVLLGLLLPAVSAGNRRGKAAQCLNNHRQIILAVQLYTTEHDGEFPSNADGVDGTGVGTNWVGGSMIRPGEGTNAALLVDPRFSLLAESIPTPRIYKCPSDSTHFVRSYSMNCRINPTRSNGEPSFTGGNGQGYEIFRTLQQIRNPSDILVTLDERWETINDGYYAIDMSNTGTLNGKGVSLPYYLVDFPGNYHDNAATVSFADGHVESHRWLEPSTIPKPGMNRFPVYTHPQDRDMGWLQAHCTYRKQE